MARTLKNYTFIADRKPKGKPGRPSLYPWTEWANGQVWSIKKGTDFKPSTAGMRTTIVGYAKRNKLTVRIDPSGKDGLVFQFKKATEPKATDLKVTPKRTTKKRTTARKAKRASTKRTPKAATPA